MIDVVQWCEDSQNDLEGYSSRLWKNAYNRGRLELATEVTEELKRVIDFDNDYEHGVYDGVTLAIRTINKCLERSKDYGSNNKD